MPTRPDIGANNREATAPEEMDLEIYSFESEGFRNGFSMTVPPASAVVIINHAE